MTDFPWLTTLTFTPLIGGFLVIGIGAQRNLARSLALTFSSVSLGLAILVWKNFDSTLTELQFVERHPWIPSLDIEYFVGVDGLSLMMILLSAIVVPMAMLASWKMFGDAPHPGPLPVGRGEGGRRPGEGDSGSGYSPPLYYALVLFLQAGLFGTFTALNFFHWFIFWELSLVPAFFLIKLWGGPQRSAAATQFFVYTMVGSVALLLSFLALYQAAGTFDFIRLSELGRSGELASALSVKLGWYDLTAKQLGVVIFAGALLGFAVKVPLVPFHTWLPLAYAEAPTPVTMLLTGAMSKMGVYGFLRILLPIFPEQVRWVLTPLMWLAVITIVFGAAAAFAQKDLKRTFAYSSINHLGYCLLGVFALAKLIGDDPRLAAEKAAVFNGVLLQMFNHGLTAATVFCFIGFIERRTGGLRGLNEFGGLRAVAPVFCGLMGIALFSSLGLPGLNGFVGEFLIFKGAFPLATWATALSVIGLLVTAVFILTVIQRVFNGPLNATWREFGDLTLSERLIVVPAIGLMFVLGIYPQLAIGAVNATVVELVAQLKF
ncbi:MAG: NADH-quinone oxidoreductase subunit M [Verrucomicrobia bacterium]|nr:MAG: NADH-quinone oxidoreductase subunit M [Verrucomicrobiota bacterium]